MLACQRPIQNIAIKSEVTMYLIVLFYFFLTTMTKQIIGFARQHSLGSHLSTHQNFRWLP
jgi:CRISPR/Cas system CMR subunit Cmr6 (Cas7 group RAMP superfamily)